MKSLTGEQIEDVLDIVKTLFSERGAGNFCGCYEGDLDNHYEKEVKQFLEDLAKKAKARKIKKVAFDKGASRFHGRVKALAEGARRGGLDF